MRLDFRELFQGEGSEGKTENSISKGKSISWQQQSCEPTEGMEM
jgi:hypothetical protein